jgi:AAA family ATP:ADP antiporter
MSDWKKRTRFVAGAIFCLAAAMVFAKTGRDALFVQGRGLFDLPKAYIGIAVLSAPLAMMALALLRIYGPRAVRVFLPLATALSLVAFSVIVHPGGGTLMTLFFMFIPLVWGILFSSSWLLASDLLDRASREQTAEAFSFIGGAAIVGGIVAAAVARQVAPYVEPRAFLWFAAMGLALGSAVMAEAQRRHPPDMRPKDSQADEARGEAAPPLLANSYTRRLMVVGMATAIVSVLIEFQFYLAASQAEGAGREKAGFFASFYLVLNLAALAVQLWVLPRLLHRIGIGGALFVLPVALVGGAGGLAASASLLVASVVRVTEGGLKSSIHRASWEQAYLSLRRSERVGAKVAVEGMAMHFAEGAAAVALLLWLRFVVGESDLSQQSTVWISSALLFSALAWLVSTRGLAREIQAREMLWDESAPSLATPPGG